MRLLLLLLTCCTLGACGGRPAPGGPGEDDAGVPDASHRDGATADGATKMDAGALQCSGPGRMVLNGTNVPVTVTGSMLFLNCCEAAELIFDPVGPNAPRVVVMWTAQVGGPAAIPFEVDLADPPDGVGVQVLSGCGDPPEYCPNPTDNLSRGLQGTLTVDGTMGFGYTMTLCLRGAAPEGETHPVLRTIELWAEGVVAPWPEY